MSRVLDATSSTTYRTDKRYRKLLSVYFFIFWLTVLYAGADHPPPVGFLFVVLMVLLGALLVYLRIPTYLSWCRSKTRCDLRKVIGDGIVAGTVFASVPIFLSFTARGVSPLSAYIIWFIVLTGVAIINVTLIYIICLQKTKRESHIRRTL